MIPMEGKVLFRGNGAFPFETHTVPVTNTVLSIVNALFSIGNEAVSGWNEAFAGENNHKTLDTTC